jgi:DUF4097 and DUF4098 domain-containing protein YvlB
MKTHAYIVAAALLFAQTAGDALAEEYSKDFQKSFEVREGYRLRLKHGDGDVTVKPWDRDQLDVTVRYRAEQRSFGWDDKGEFNVEFHEDDGVIEIIGHERRSKFLGVSFYRTIEYGYTIRAPRYLELDINGDDGNVDIEGWRSEIECSLDDGNVRLIDVGAPHTRIEIEDGNIDIDRHNGALDIFGDDGDVTITDSAIPSCRIEVEDGDVEISDGTGDCDIRTDDGDVDLRRFGGGIVEILSGDGDIDVDMTASGEIDMELTTDDGNITLELDPRTSAAFTIDVDDGSFRLDVPSASDVKKGRRWISGTIGSGGGRIKIKTNDGRIVVKERD